MKAEFWHERWENGQIGFHQDETNTYLLKHWQQLRISKNDCVFVPMAGKSKDILWLSDQGFQVIAIEINEQAVITFFAENSLEYTVHSSNPYTIYQSGNIKFYCGDFFNLTSDMLSTVKAVFDRASLIALPADMRKSYAEKMQQILPKQIETLLVTMEYPQQQMDGPPFSVLQSEVNKLFADSFEIHLLETFDVLAENPRFADKGLTSMVEKVFKMKRK